MTLGNYELLWVCFESSPPSFGVMQVVFDDSQASSVCSFDSLLFVLMSQDFLGLLAMACHLMEELAPSDQQY